MILNGIETYDVLPTYNGGKPTYIIQKSVLIISGIINLIKVDGLANPNPSAVKPENILGRSVKIGFYNRLTSKFVYGTAFCNAQWNPQEDTTWTFNKSKEGGSNPFIVNWANKSLSKQIDLIFEFVLSIK